jgi:ABC-type antimicrobial peptide transport system permease subunit
MLHVVRHEIRVVDRNVPMTFTDSVMNYLKRFSYAEPRFAVTLLGIFAGVGPVLVAIGVYSVIAYTVTRQTQEIGIRIALGAAPANVQRMVLIMGARLVLLGVVGGLSVTFAVTHVLASELFGASPRDPMTLAAVVAVIGGVGGLACLLPARRATSVDPMLVLRYE